MYEWYQSVPKRPQTYRSCGSAKYKNMFIYVNLIRVRGHRILRKYIDLQYKIGYNHITIIKLLHRIVHTLMIQMQS